jgi:PEGA domain
MRTTSIFRMSFARCHTSRLGPRGLCCAALVAIMTMGVTYPAAAAEPAITDTAFEDQINQGIALRRAGKDDAALGVFLDLEKRSPDSVRLLLHITTAALAIGEWTVAYDYMQKAAAHKDDPYYQRHKAAIETVDRAIAQHVGQFRANGSPAGAEVRLSGAVIGTLPMGDAKPIEVGSYMLEVSKPGFFPLRRPVTIPNDGTLAQEEVDLREQKSFSASVALGQPASQSEPTPDSGPSSPEVVWWRSRAVTWSLLGVGVAAGAASGIAFGIRENDVNVWNSNSCLNPGNPMETRGDKCPGRRHDIDVAEDVGIATGIAAAAFAAAALVHGLATSQRSTEGATHAEAHVGCTPGLGSVVCSGSF